MLTACGIETNKFHVVSYDDNFIVLQQCLPLAVLKPATYGNAVFKLLTVVATVLTACGIETIDQIFTNRCKWYYVATVLTACGIETHP